MRELRKKGWFTHLRDALCANLTQFLEALPFSFSPPQPMGFEIRRIPWSCDEDEGDYHRPVIQLGSLKAWV